MRLSSTTVLLVRHGATQANTCRPYLLQGRTPDHDLTEVGRAQAQATAVALKPYPITRVYASPLKRALQTATIIANHLNVETVIEENLVEADVGVWSGFTWNEVERRWPTQFQAFQENAEQHGYLGGENMQQVCNRIGKVLKRLHEEHKGQTIAIVAHGVVNRVLLADGMGIPLRYARKIPQDNGGFNHLELNDAGLKVKTVNAAA